MVFGHPVYIGNASISLTYDVSEGARIEGFMWCYVGYNNTFWFEPLKYIKILNRYPERKMSTRFPVRESKCSALIEYSVNRRGVTHSIHRCGREVNHPGVHVCDVEGCNFVWGFVLSEQEKDLASGTSVSGAELRKVLMSVNASATTSGNRRSTTASDQPVRQK